MFVGSSWPRRLWCGPGAWAQSPASEVDGVNGCVPSRPGRPSVASSLRAAHGRWESLIIYPEQTGRAHMCTARGHGAGVSGFHGADESQNPVGGDGPERDGAEPSPHLRAPRGSRRTAITQRPTRTRLLHLCVWGLHTSWRLCLF